MSAKLRRPWLVKRLAAPHPSVTVFLVEERGGLWYPVIERHQGCRGMTHATCTVLSRLVGDRGFSTMVQAEDAMADAVASAPSGGPS